MDDLLRLTINISLSINKIIEEILIDGLEKLEEYSNSK